MIRNATNWLLSADYSAHSSFAGNRSVFVQEFGGTHGCQDISCKSASRGAILGCVNCLGNADIDVLFVVSQDDAYNSGVPGKPGTRFVIDFCANSIRPSDHLSDDQRGKIGTPLRPPSSVRILRNSDPSQEFDTRELPKELTVLFVDDDTVLRKLFVRAVRKACPEWTVLQAANGEASIKMVEDGKSFDLIFVDMYMASVEKQLLGTETVVALRNLGVKSRISGLSANDKEQEFLAAGANSFMIKPFPCDEEGMRQALLVSLYGDEMQLPAPREQAVAFKESAPEERLKER